LPRFLSLFLILLQCACQPGKTGGDKIVIAQSAEPRSLDPQVATGNTDFQVASQIFEGLVKFRRGSLEVGPSLAKDWEVLQDGKVYRFFLKENVTFHDGTPFNAESVVFTFERMLDPDHESADTGPFPLSFFFSSVEKVVAENASTVRFELSEPFAPLLSNLAYPTGYIVSPTALGKHGKEFGRNPVGTGPYQFAGWDSRRRIVLERNESFHGQPAAMENVYYRPVQDPNTRITDLLSGQVDLVLEVPAALVSFLDRKEGFSTSRAVGPHLWFVILNLRNPALQDVRLRRAMQLAIDRQGIANDLLQGTASVPSGPIPEAFDWIDLDTNPMPFDPAEARRLVEAVKEDRGGIPPLTFLATESGSGMLEPLRMAEAIQADLRAVGLEVEIEVYEWNSYLAKVNGGLEGTGDLAEMAWMVNDPDTLPYLALRREAWPEGGGFNSGYYENPLVDSWIETARRELDPEKRADLYRKIHHKVREDLPWLFIASWRQTVVYQSDLDGVELQSSFLLPMGPVRREDKQ